MITVLYDSTYCVDKHSHTEDTHLTVAYKEHAQNVMLKMFCMHYACILLNDAIQCMLYVLLLYIGPHFFEI